MDRAVERRQRFVAGFPTKKAAERARIEALASASLHGQTSPARITVGDFLVRDWLPARQPRTAAAGRRHRGQLGVSTWASYSDVIDAYVIPHIGHVRLQDLTAEHLDRLYLASKPLEAVVDSRCLRRRCSTSTASCTRRSKTLSGSSG